jgi:hypothetical protein
LASFERQISCVQPLAVYVTTNRVEETQHSDEMAWLVAQGEALSRFAGQWLLVVGNEVVEHSVSLAAIRAAIRERGLRSPFVYRVPRVEESNFTSI